MCFLSFISFLLLPTPLDSITWQVSPGWEQEGLESWTLDAPSAGIYTVSGCTVEPFEELTLDMRWRQDLYGSNNNNSRFFISDTELSDTIGEFTNHALVLSIGENGSNDPITVSSTFSDLSTEITSGFFNFSEPFDLDLSVNLSTQESIVALHAGQYNEGWKIPVISQLNIVSDSLTNNWQPRCFGFEVLCTSSNTDAFSWGLHRLSTTESEISEPRLLSHRAIDSTVVELVWSRPLSSQNPAMTISNNSPHISFLTLSSPLSDEVFKDIKLQNSEIDTVIQVIYTQLNSAEFRDLVITELFIDATPAIGFPEVEWFEILNRSDKYVDMNRWSVTANSTASFSEPSDIIPRNGWSGILAPKERFLISTFAFDSCEFEPYPQLQAELPGFSSLNDNGMTLTLLRPDGTLIDQIIYDRTWWQPYSIPARSTSKIYTGGCGLSSNWAPTFNITGANPWFAGENETSEPNCLIESFNVNAHLLTADIVEFSFSQDIDPLCEITVSGNDFSSYLHWENSSWIVNLSSPLPLNESLDIQFDGARLCSCDTTFSFTLSDWTPVASPEWGDLKITGFLTNPSTSSGFNEWVNVLNTSPHSIDLYNLQINSNHLINAPILTPNESFKISSLNTEQWGSLAEKSGVIEIKLDEVVIDIVEYSWCWHLDKEKAEGGYPLKRIGNFEASNSGENWRTDIHDESVIEGTEPMTPNTIVFGLLDGILAWHAPYSMDSTVLLRENWLPPIDWEFYGSGQNCAIAMNLPISYEDSTSIFLQCNGWLRAERSALIEDKFWSIPLNEDPESVVYINELLSNPNIRGGEFIEVAMRNPLESEGLTSARATTHNLMISSTESPTPNDFVRLAEIDWMFPESGILAFSECPSWVINRKTESVILELQTPSLQHGRELILAKVEDTITEIDRVEIKDLPENISQERVDDLSAVWVRSPYSQGGSSPGFNNFSTQLNAENVNVRLGELDIFPKTINLNPHSDNNWVQIYFELKDNIEELEFITSVSIYNFNGEEVVKLAERELVHKRGTWAWEGYRENGLPVSSGTYLVVLQIEHLSKKLINRGLIQVGYY
jgi:hypothetical protein